VKVHLLDGGAVHLGLGFGEPPEHLLRAVAHARGQVGLLEDRIDVVEVAMGLLLGVLDAHVPRRERPATDVAHEDPHPLEPQAGGQAFQLGRGPARRDERGQRHVAGHSGDAVEVCVVRHHLLPTLIRCAA
jgi:hypothetical protein